MLSAAQIKHISSLRNPKFRELNGQTIAEGSKLIRELLLTGFSYEQIYATELWADSQPDLARGAGNRLILCSPKELERMSALRSPQGVIALLPIPDPLPPEQLPGITLFCDRISDPGNMGTILRIADWFGIGQVITSPGSANIFNPKVVQASMGSIFRVRHSVNTLTELIDVYDEKPGIYAAVTDGIPLHQQSVPSGNAVIVIGNESEGISEETLNLCTHRIAIPGKPGAVRGESAESLNAAIATAIICYHFTTGV